MRGFQNGWMAIAGATLAVGCVVACSVGCSAADGAVSDRTGNEGAAAEGASATSADALDIGDVKEGDYSFVIATRTRTRAGPGYRVASLNGAPLNGSTRCCSTPATATSRNSRILPSVKTSSLK